MAAYNTKTSTHGTFARTGASDIGLMSFSTVSGRIFFGNGTTVAIANIFTETTTNLPIYRAIYILPHRL